MSDQDFKATPRSAKFHYGHEGAAEIPHLPARLGLASTDTKQNLLDDRGNPGAGGFAGLPRDGRTGAI